MRCGIVAAATGGGRSAPIIPCAGLLMTTSMRAGATFRWWEAEEKGVQHHRCGGIGRLVRPAWTAFSPFTTNTLTPCSACPPTRKFDRKSQVFCLGNPGRLGCRAKLTSMERIIRDSVQRRPGPCGSTWDLGSTVADRPGWDPQPLCSCRFARQQSPPALNKL